MLAQQHVLPSLIADRAAATPDRLFLLDTDGRQVTYGELQDRIMRWAAAFAAAGVEAGDTVITMLPNRLESFEIWLGLAWLRAIEVPLNTAYRGPMLEHTVNNSTARLAIVAPAFAAQFDEVRPAFTTLTRVETPEGFIDGVAPATSLEPPCYFDIACMIYTSGTTGPSKGVLMPWAELFQFVTTIPADALGPDEANYLCLPVFHVSGKAGIYIAADFDGRLVVRDTFSLTEFWSDVRRFDVKLAGLVGVMASFLMTLPEQPDDADNPLRSVMMGPLVPDVEDFRRRFDVRVGTGYGMTEIAAPLASDGWNLANTTSCGRLRAGYPGYELRVVDEFDEPLGPNEVGELIVRTAEPWTLNAGYFNMPAETAAAWRNGWFHTGDGFRYDEDGNFYFVDRLKDAIRRRGENISSFEVESYVSRHPAVQEVAAIGVPSEHGEDEVKVVVVLADGAADSFDPAELIESLVPTMPKFMVPRYVQVVDALPKTPTLRVRKVELRADEARTTWDREGLIRFVSAGAIAIALATPGCGGSTDETTKSSVTVFAAASLTEAFTGFHPDGVTVRYSFGGSGALVTQVQQGAPADVIATADTASMQQLVDAGLVEMPATFARNKLEILVSTGNPKAIKTLADLARPDVTYITEDDSVPAGRYAAQILQRAGVMTHPKSKELDVKAAAAKVTTGEADATVVYVTDVTAAGARGEGVPIPDAQNVITEYPIAIVKATKHRKAAATFVNDVVVGAGQGILRKHGFLPPG